VCFVSQGEEVWTRPREDANDGDDDDDNDDVARK
jgi:hypothetical protein